MSSCSLRSSKAASGRACAQTMCRRGRRCGPGPQLWPRAGDPSQSILWYREAMRTPLDGIRVLDWTIWQQGPFATALLADLGAEVIKLETLDGDPGRAIFAVSGATTARNGKNFYFESNNRHKKSIKLDLKQPEAREIVHQLVAKSDVFVQNYRKGVAQRLGLDYQTLRAINPKLIYATASGYGPEGPDSGEPSFDYLAQAR